ncbi:unnamed protein product [Adineta steineri]|uniref:Uncharacterized protein n=1 Tax=Adineta steineri TaxID=433720 RepID=A0A815S101_9BILA|nr:unnamed protein product [Adineta steineri]CAF3611634.1 unnamed protein product [Adineta steineri]
MFNRSVYQKTHGLLSSKQQAKSKTAMQPSVPVGRLIYFYLLFTIAIQTTYGSSTGLKIKRQISGNSNPYIQSGGQQVTNGMILYIDETPQMPPLTAVSTDSVRWTITFHYRAAIANPVSFPDWTISVTSSPSFPADITLSLLTKVIGGEVTAVWKEDITGQSGQLEFKILGKNPSKAAVFAYIDSLSSLWYTKMIAIQESKNNQVVQFGTDGYPVASYDNGYGIFQLTGCPTTPTIDQVWNWKTNVLGGVSCIANKGLDAVRLLNKQKVLSAHTVWVPLLQMNVTSYSLLPTKQVGLYCNFSDDGSTRQFWYDAEAIKLYNGGQYIKWINGAWSFIPGQNNYVENVCNRNDQI